ncbi:hypothetical protein ACFX2A_035391 [Malus domestica]
MRQQAEIRSSRFATKDVIRLGKFLSLPRSLLYNGRILNIRNGTIDEVLGCGFQDISVGESTLVWMELATSGMPTRDVRNDLCKFFFLLGNVSWFCVYRLTI